jgi:hypothetical protein
VSGWPFSCRRIGALIKGILTAIRGRCHGT